MTQWIEEWPKNLKKSLWHVTHTNDSSRRRGKTELLRTIVKGGEKKHQTNWNICGWATNRVTLTRRQTRLRIRRSAKVLRCVTKEGICDSTNCHHDRAEIKKKRKESVSVKLEEAAGEQDVPLGLLSAWQMIDLRACLSTYRKRRRAPRSLSAWQLCGLSCGPRWSAAPTQIYSWN